MTSESREQVEVTPVEHELVRPSSVRWSFAIALGIAFLLGCRTAARLASGRPEWRVLEGTPEDYGLAADFVRVRSADDLRVAGWWLAGDASGTPTRGTVILAHGIGGNRGSMLPIAAFLVAAGYDVLVIDLRAHGDSEGTYPSPGYLEVAEITAAIEYARRRGSVPVILLGHSYGGVAVLHTLGRGVDVTAAIADSAFVSFFDMMEGVRAGQSSRWTRLGLRLVASRRLAGVTSLLTRIGGGPRIDARHGDLMPVLPRIRCPVLFITGDRDSLALTATARSMAAAVAVPGTRVAELQAGHETYADAPSDYESAVLGFLDEVVGTPPTGSRSRSAFTPPRLPGFS